MVLLLHYPVRLSVRGVTVMLRMRYAWALAAGCLLAPAPAHPASGQLILSCKDEATPRNMHGASRTSDEALLVFDFDRDMLFDDRAATTGLPGAPRLTRSKSSSSPGSLTMAPGRGT